VVELAAPRRLGREALAGGVEPQLLLRVGRVPVRIERELPDDTTTTPHQHPETAPKSKTDDAASIPAKKAVDD
jgi:hypothetical protein